MPREPGPRLKGGDPDASDAIALRRADTPYGEKTTADKNPLRDPYATASTLFETDTEAT